MIEVLKQMQEALREYHYYTIDAGLPNQSMLNKGYAAYQAGQQAIAELESQEPVGALTLGGIIDTSDGLEYEGWDVEWDAKVIEALQEKLVTSDSVEVMLYTHPPQRTWVGLTKDEVDSWNMPDHPTVFEFAQFIEAKLKEKNT